MQKLSYLNHTNASYIEELFEKYSENPESIDPSWRYFFDGLNLGTETSASVLPLESTPQTQAPTAPRSPERPAEFNREAQVAQLILAYREFGKYLAQINPLAPPQASHPRLELSRFGLSSADLKTSFQAGKLIGLGGPASLETILAHLKQTYGAQIAVEFTHIEDSNEQEWLRAKMEASQNRPNLDAATQKRILARLTESETFERFLHTRYVAQKRFSIEGGEALIPALDRLIEQGAELGADEFVMGMAHRGRLNVLTLIFGKKPELIFTEFEGAYAADLSKGEGDVKYHMGFSTDFTTVFGKKVHLSLASNPSHLEFVHPVIEGMTYAKQQHKKDSEKSRVIPIAIHGDAAFSGQGVCYETLNFSQLKGYGTGGTIHFVINNQVGFTTSPEQSRSTPYSTDVSKMLQVPIFHVNGDDPEALWYVTGLCVEYRQKFKKDVIIDLVCYRKHGHNEGDEPSFTQPLLYKTIKSHASPRERYAQKLRDARIVTEEEAQQWINQGTSKLSEAQARTKAEAPRPYVSSMEGLWSHLKRPQDQDLFSAVQTAVPEERLRALSQKLNQMPAGFQLHSKLSRFFEARAKAVDEGKGLDWGNAEILAYATLLEEGHPVRLSGQDVERGTFTHRHSVLNDFETGKTHTPLNHLKEGQASFDVHNSLLSETAVLGFEYGYSIASPHALSIWEAQFGDFANGAQVIIDQFIASSESKWQRMSGLTLLLPHGFEGQGPEHSSARLERFLQLCGKNNLSVCNLSTPAQIFHALRRQVKRDFRKPLVVMSPKSLLRHPLAVSDLRELSKGSFQEVLNDPTIQTAADAAKIKTVLLCSGKVYYDLIQAREKMGSPPIAVIRIEQLYPWPEAQLAQILEQYKKAKTLIWVQEEPKNMGAWSYIFNLWSGGFDFFQEKAGNRPIHYVGREIGAAPAVGSHKIHEKQQEALIHKALNYET
ncbi:MAG: 2-oxoglutarate dehydrogenase E1 component [Bdellovibrionia bacterium]